MSTPSVPNYFNFHIDDFFGSERVMSLTPEMQINYLRLLAFQWKNETLPGDIHVLQKICGISEARRNKKEEFQKVVQMFFKDRGDGRLINERMDAERERFFALVKARKDSGQKGGKTRWAKKSAALSRNDHPVPTAMFSTKKTTGSPKPAAAMSSTKPSIFSKIPFPASTDVAEGDTAKSVSPVTPMETLTIPEDQNEFTAGAPTGEAKEDLTETVFSSEESLPRKENDENHPSLVSVDPMQENSTKSEACHEDKNIEPPIIHRISFSHETGTFLNLSEIHVQEWQQRFPAVDVRTELEKMAQWLVKSRKQRSNYQQFITNWLRKTNIDKTPAKVGINNTKNDYRSVKGGNHTSWGKTLFKPDITSVQSSFLEEDEKRSVFNVNAANA